MCIKNELSCKSFHEVPKVFLSCKVSLRLLPQVSNNPRQPKHFLLNTRPYMSNLKAKIKRQVFQKNSTKKEDRELYNVLFVDLCIQLFFFPKDHVKSHSEQNFKKINIKNIKVKQPVALFKKKSRKLCLFLKTESQNFINAVVRCLHNEKDVKKTVKRKIRKVRVF